VQIRSIKLVCFSPTRTTRTILQSIARGISAEAPQLLDFTLPAERAGQVPPFGDELTLLGAPVYAGRVPLDAADYLSTLTARQTPAVPVVVYGNRAYDDALLELCDIAAAAGFVPFAAGAFVGEHSFSTAETPLAPGRPDERDLARAQAFGTRIKSKLEQSASVADVARVSVPGSFPYRKRVRLFGTAPATSAEHCTQCGECAPVCPKGAIDADDATRTDSEKCIFCCACIRVCPERARFTQDAEVGAVVDRLVHSCRERREPETFL
jgi:ferredoxin